jgi:nickel-dependent lactate racemase
MSRASIEANHAGAMSPRAGAMVLEGNPIHEGIVRALATLERGGARLFAINQLVVGGSAVAAWAGSPLRALEDALPAVRSCFAHRVEKPVDVIVAEVHPPLDRDLYQADKGIKNVEAAVRDGGFLIVEAACENGVGIDHFLGLLKEARSYADALAIVERRGYRLGDHKAVRLRALTDTRAVHVALISPGIDPMLGDALGMAVFADHQSAARWLTERIDVASARGLLVEDAANVALELA